MKKWTAANSFNFGPRYFDKYASKIPLSATSTFHIKFKDLNR